MFTCIVTGDRMGPKFAGRVILPCPPLRAPVTPPRPRLDSDDLVFELTEDMVLIVRISGWGTQKKDQFGGLWNGEPSLTQPGLPWRRSCSWSVIWWPSQARSSVDMAGMLRVVRDR